jgi:hypothetical protein
MLWQLHHQFKNGKTDMQAQKDFPLKGDVDNINDLFRIWFQEVKKTNPLPAEAQWLCCNQDSEDFVLGMSNERVVEPVFINHAPPKGYSPLSKNEVEA